MTTAPSRHALVLLALLVVVAAAMWSADPPLRAAPAPMTTAVVGSPPGR